MRPLYYNIKYSIVLNIPLYAPRHVSDGRVVAVAFDRRRVAFECDGEGCKRRERGRLYYCYYIPRALQRPYRIRRLRRRRLAYTWFDGGNSIFFPAIYLLFIEKISGKGGGTEYI